MDFRFLIAPLIRVTGFKKQKAATKKLTQRGYHEEILCKGKKPWQVGRRPIWGSMCKGELAGHGHLLTIYELWFKECILKLAHTNKDDAYLLDDGFLNTGFFDLEVEGHGPLFLFLRKSGVCSQFRVET